MHVLKTITQLQAPTLLVWHGLGDSYDSPGMAHAIDTLREVLPGKLVHAVYLSGNDQQRSFWGNVWSDLEEVCKQVSQLPQPVDMLGFSQGGLFLRSLAQTCSSITVRNLLTMGSPHDGFQELPVCHDWACSKRNAILKGRMYDTYIQNHVVPAQYYKSLDYLEFLDKSAFLKYVNYPETFGKAWKWPSDGKIGLVLFEKDETLLPAESAWFGEQNFTDTEQYKNDFIGWKKLYDDGKIDFISTNTKHMEFSDALLKDLAVKYFI